ncbi:MAG: hypothetical protein ABI612_24915, partial [Betaproteobacteria bacterium]
MQLETERVADLQAIGASMARPNVSEDYPPMPALPTLVDIFTLRLHKPKFGLPIASAAHNAQCGLLALK